MAQTQTYQEIPKLSRKAETQIRSAPRIVHSADSGSAVLAVGDHGDGLATGRSSPTTLGDSDAGAVNAVEPRSFSCDSAEGHRNCADLIAAQVSPGPSSSDSHPPKLICGLAAAFIAEQRQRRQIQVAFSQYVAPTVIERLLDNPALLNLGGETRDMTILFADIRGFTAIAERMKHDPQSLTRIINTILTPLADIVLAHGGTIDKYIGDCVMAFWGAPLDDKNHAQHAIQAGLAMVEKMAAINVILREIIPEGGGVLPIRIGVGINSGDCVVGNMGSRRRFDYSVLGDAVNIASRLEGLTKVYGVPIVVGEGVARHLPQGYCLQELDRVAVRGRHESQAVYSVVRQSAQ
jgi:adenylate cyclase